MSCSRRDLGDETHGTDRLLQFLLFLTALVAGFTGVFSGGRAVEPREVGQAIAAAASVSEVAPRPVGSAVIQAVREAATFAPALVRAAPPRIPALLPRLAPVDERRIE